MSVQTAAEHTSVEPSSAPIARWVFLAGHEIRFGLPGLCTVLEGSAEIVAHAEPPLSRRNRLVRIIGPGQLVLLPLEVPAGMPANGIRLLAARECTVHFVAWDALDELWAGDPAYGARLLAIAARSVRETQNAVAALTQYDVAGRLARELLIMRRRDGRTVPGGVRVEHGLTQGELADLVGASRETACRVLNRFAVRGWIRFDRASVTILSPAGLASRIR